jgi:hypothetical protein
VGLPENHTHFYAMVFGHPKIKYYRLPERKPATIIWKYHFAFSLSLNLVVPVDEYREDDLPGEGKNFPALA